MKRDILLIQIAFIVVFSFLSYSVIFAESDEVEMELDEDEVKIEIDGETIDIDEDEELGDEGEIEKKKEVKVLILKDDEESDVGIVKIGEDDIIVKENEKVDGDVVGVGGDVSVFGVVQGDVVCIGGVLEVGPEAHITGDVVSVGGELNVDPNAVIDGQKTKVGMHLPFGMKLGKFFEIFHDTLTQRVFGVLKTVGWLIVWLLIGLAMVAFAPKHFDKMKDSYEKEFLITSLAGLITTILIPVLSVILFFTIIGIPIIPLLWVVFLISGFIGLSALASVIAEKIFPKLGDNKYTSTIVGILLVDAILLIGRLITLPGGVFAVIGEYVSGLGSAIVLVGFIIGIGSIVLTRFGKRSRTEGKEVTEKE